MNQNCYINQNLLNRAEDNVLPEHAKMSSTVLTRMVNRKVFGYESFSGEETGDSSGTVTMCWQDVSVGRMRKATSKLGIDEAMRGDRLRFLKIYACTGVDYWILNQIWHDPNIIGANTLSEAGSNQSVLSTRSEPSWESIETKVTSSGSREPSRNSRVSIRMSGAKRDIRSHFPKEILLEQTLMDVDSSRRRLLSIPRSVSIAELWNGGLAARIGLNSIVQIETTQLTKTSSKPLGLKSSGRRRRLDSVVAAKSFETKVAPEERTFEADMNSRITEVDDEGAVLSMLEGNIKVCTLKISGLKAEKVKYIAWYIRRHNIDVLFIQDTQLTVATAHWRKVELKQELGEDSYITSSAREESNIYTDVGGQMVIVMPRWAPDIANVDTTDASSTGVIMAIYLKTKIGTLMVVSTYWPYDSNPDGNGLAAGIGRWMTKCNRTGTCMEYIQDRIHRLLLNHQSNSSNATIMCGDFNACYHKQKGGPKIRPAKTDDSAAIIVECVVSGAADASVESNANSGNVALITMNKKQPSKALKKNWSRRQGGRGRGKGSQRGGNDNSELDSEALKLISSQKSFEPWATHCCLINPIADYCQSNNRIMFTRYCGDVGTGFIDHHLHFPMNLTCTDFHTTTSAQWTALGISDHRPLAATYNISGGRRTELSRKITSREYQTPVFDNKDEDMCRELEGVLTELLAGKPPTAEISVKAMDTLLEEISTLSANTIRKCNMRRNSSFNSAKRAMKGGWSPHMRALTAQLTMMIEMRRHLSGFAKRRRRVKAAEIRSGVQ